MGWTNESWKKKDKVDPEDEATAAEGSADAPKATDEVVIPDKAKGNPVYEQTSQDMPMFCCGKKCGRNSR